MSEVRSLDGTPIAYTRTGSGPALIQIDGALCSRAFGPSTKLAARLAPTLHRVCLRSPRPRAER